VCVCACARVFPVSRTRIAGQDLALRKGGAHVTLPSPLIQRVLTPVKVTFGCHGRGLTLSFMTKRALTRRLPAACVGTRFGFSEFGFSG
jgi:hypothetical protein